MTPFRLLALASLLSSLTFAASPAIASQIAYVANAFEGTVSAVDLRTGAMLATIPVGCDPRAIVADPHRGRVYVANTCYGDLDAQPGSVSVIDVATNTVVDTIPTAFAPVALALDETRHRLYVACQVEVPFSDEDSNGELESIDLVTGGRDAIPLSLVPSGLALSRDGRHAFVSGVAGARDDEDHIRIAASGVVDVGLEPFGTVSPFIAGPGGPLDVSPRGDRLFVLDRTTNELAVLDTATGAEIARLPVGVAAQDVLVDWPRRRVWVTSTGDSPNQLPDAIVMIDARRNLVGATFNGGWAPVGLARVKGTGLLLATNFYSGALLVLRERNGELVRSIPVGVGADAIALVRR